MAHRDAFVAEVAVDLEHPVKAADDQALQIQLGRDAQEHLLVQRVVVGGKWFGVGAAWNGVQHGRLHFQKAVVHHEFADATDCFATRDKAFARGPVSHQVDVALAVFDLLVGDAVELVWHGPQAFGQQAHAGGVDGQFAGFGFEQAALSGHDVA